MSQQRWPNIRELVDACYKGDLDEVKKWVTWKNVNGESTAGNCPLKRAASYGRTKVVKYLLRRSDELGLNVNNADCGTPLYYALDDGFTDIVKMLLVRKDIRTNVKMPDRSRINGPCRKLLKEYASSPKTFRVKYSHLLFAKKDELIIRKKFLKNERYRDVHIKVVNLENPLSK